MTISRVNSGSRPARQRADRSRRPSRVIHAADARAGGDRQRRSDRACARRPPRSRLMALSHDHGGAARNARRALELLEASEHTYFRARAHGLLAYAELDAGNPSEQRHCSKRAETSSARTLHASTMHGSISNRPESLAQLGSPEEAACAGDASRSHPHRGGHPGDVARCYAELARAFALLDDLPRGRSNSTSLRSSISTRRVRPSSPPSSPSTPTCWTNGSHPRGTRRLQAGHDPRDRSACTGRRHGGVITLRGVSLDVPI